MHRIILRYAIIFNAGAPMKLAFAAFAMLLTTTSFAETRIIELDGERYSCELENSSDPGNAVSCSEKAFRGPFNREESVALCKGARSDAPADCGIRAFAGPFNKQESVNLCKGARNLGPAQCGEAAFAGPFSKEESVAICAGPSATKKNAECAVKAYAGVSSKAEAIELCRASRGGRFGIMSSNASILAPAKADTDADKDAFEQILIEANKKAVMRGEFK